LLANTLGLGGFPAASPHRVNFQVPSAIAR
jgi:hypothetical protein